MNDERTGGRLASKIPSPSPSFGPASLPLACSSIFGNHRRRLRRQQAGNKSFGGRHWRRPTANFKATGELEFEEEKDELMSKHKTATATTMSQTHSEQQQSSRLSDDYHQESDQQQQQQQRRQEYTKVYTRRRTLTSLFTILVAVILVGHPLGLNERSNENTGAIRGLGFPSIMLVAGAPECSSNNDCDQSVGKICHENKCICGKDTPVEDQDRCLGLALIHEPCALTEQCLGNSSCIEGICACTNEAVLLLNRIPNIYYCLPKSRLNEECSFDSQCPRNSYCSTKKYGCICQNGFSPTLVNTSNRQESLECVPKVCQGNSDCETEFHKCEKNKCICLTTNYDIHSGKCYKNGQSGGISLDQLQQLNGTGNSSDTNSVTGIDINFRSILKDLSENSDSIWLVLIILIFLTLAFILLIFMLMRRYYLGYCWTAHKKEYEPNSKNPPKNDNYFNKNSINNKSFRQKNGDLDGDDETEVRSNLVTSTEAADRLKIKLDGSSSRMPFVTTKALDDSNSKSHNHYVKVNMANSNSAYNNDNSKLYQHQDQGNPLVTSISTPV